jgi:DNA helicase-2/ATP-dependent DNA helicase PcrA
VDRAYREYKKANGLLDYTDTLVMFAENMADYCPRFKVCFLDEAQDLSPLQWDIAHGLDKYSEKMYCAGDDDQAIYRWAGADINQFIHLPGGSETLEQSYRIPQSVHTVADKIVSRITDRYPKRYLPRQEQGTVERIYDLSEADLSHGSWLILTQANYMLDPLDATLRSMGYLFERPRQRSISEKLSEAVNGWEALRKGNEVSLHTAQCVYGYMSGNGVRITRGHKKILEDETATFTLEKLQKQHGLLASEDQIWHEAMDKLPDADRAYIVALLRRGEKFNAPPRIRLSTIHQAKGGEADNVVLFSDLAPAAALDFNNDTHRVFYVGVTRTRKNLYIVEPQSAHLSYPI